MVQRRYYVSQWRFLSQGFKSNYLRNYTFGTGIIQSRPPRKKTRIYYRICPCTVRWDICQRKGDGAPADRRIDFSMCEEYNQQMCTLIFKMDKKPCSTSFMGPASSTAIGNITIGCVTAVTVTVIASLVEQFIVIFVFFFKRARLNEFRSPFCVLW